MNNKNEITLQQAIDWTTLWRETCKNNCKAFLIPVSDVINVLEEMNVLEQQGQGNMYKLNEGVNRDIRAYMAIDPSPGLPGGGEKILIVGTEKVPNPAGNPKFLYKDIIKGKPTELGDGDGDSGVYDLTQPCPNLCDDNSPLNGGG